VDRTTPRGDGHLNFHKCEVVGRRSVGRQYILLTLISYTPLRYVRNVAREEYGLKMRVLSFSIVTLS